MLCRDTPFRSFGTFLHEDFSKVVTMANELKSVEVILLFLPGSPLQDVPYASKSALKDKLKSVVILPFLPSTLIQDDPFARKNCKSNLTVQPSVPKMPLLHPKR